MGRRDNLGQEGFHGVAQVTPICIYFCFFVYKNSAIKARRMSRALALQTANMALNLGTRMVPGAPLGVQSKD